MKALTQEECKAWLTAAGVRHAPYASKKRSKHYYRIGVPTNRSRASAFVRNLIIHGVIPDGEVQLEIDDWASYQEDEMVIVKSFRNAFGENRDLVSSPGHVFTVTELNACVGLFNLTLAYGWSAYIYIVAPSLTILNWEGEIFDFWSEHKEPIDLVRKYCDLHEIHSTAIA